MLLTSYGVLQVDTFLYYSEFPPLAYDNHQQAYYRGQRKMCPQSAIVKIESTASVQQGRSQSCSLPYMIDSVTG